MSRIVKRKVSNLRVLILHPAMAPYRVDFFNFLSEKVELKVVFLQENAVSQEFDQKGLLRKCKFSYHWLLDGFSVFGHYFRFGLYRLLKEFKPDIVVTHEFLGISLQILLILLGKRGPAHFIWTAGNPQIFFGYGRIRKWVEWLFLRVVDGLMVYSSAMEATYRQSLRFKKCVAVVPNIPHEASYRALLLNAGPLSRELVTKNSWDSKRVLLFVGRLAPEKALDRVLAALVGIEGGGEDWVLLIIGDGAERERLERLSLNLGLSKSVFFLGSYYREGLSAFYRIGTLFILPSSREPFGAVVNEALMAGMPVICTEEVGAKVWIDGYKNGVVVDGSSEGALREQIKIWLQRGLPAGERAARLWPSLLSTKLELIVDSLVDKFEVIVKQNQSRVYDSSQGK